MSSIKEEYPVVIVGAGPTGLALAVQLKALGVDAIILDKLTAGTNTSRAAAVHARTLEVLEPLGVVPEFLRNGIRLSTFRMRDKAQVLATISFKDLKTKYPFLLACSQAMTEEILLQKLHDLGGKVYRPCEVVAIHPEESLVRVEFHSEGELKTIFAKWLVGCDGMHSLVREQVGISFEGGRYDENFVLADVEMNWPLGREEGDLFLSKQGLFAAIPLPGNHFRLIATVKEARAAPSIQDLHQIILERVPDGAAISIKRLIWSSRFHIQHRVAATMHQGRVLLIGDAAHVHSPAGGQGMNTGIQEAVSLAYVLKEIISGGTEEIIDAWEKKRLRIAHSVVTFTHYLTKVLTLSSPTLQFLRNHFILLIGKIPWARHALARKLSELDN